MTINADATHPVLMKIKASTAVALTHGTNALNIGKTGSLTAYYNGSSDSDPNTLGLSAEKIFEIVTDITLIASLVSAIISASKALTISAITAANTQTVTIGGQVYTFNTSLTNTANNVLIGADVTAMALNLARAINAGAGAGTLYGTGTVANASVTATSSLGVLTATAIVPGTAGNSVAISETLTNAAWAGGATTLSGGDSVSPVGQMNIYIEG